MLKGKWWTGIVAAGAALTIAACGAPAESGSEPSAGQESAAGQQGQGQGEQGAKPDLSGIPDVVAEVNGTKISKKEFVALYETQYQQMTMQAQGQGVDEKKLKTQTAENMVSTELLGQEAHHRGIKVSQKKVDKALDETAKSSQMSRKDFIKAMGEQGMDEKQVHSQLKLQLEIEELVDDQFGEFKVSDEEIGAAYQKAKTQQEQQGQMGQQGAQGGQQQELPPLKEMRPQLEEQVKGQKETQATQKYAGKLRKKADVTINV